MSDDLFAFLYGDWEGDNWINQSVTPETTAAAGSGNNLSVDLGIGGLMSGDVDANDLTVAEPYPGLGSVEFDGTVSVDSIFELSTASTMDTGPGLLIDGGDLVTSSTLIAGAGATLEVTGGGAIDSSGTLQVFGEIDVNDGSLSADQMFVQGTFDLISGSGTIVTLVVGSFTGTGGLGGIGELEIAAGNTITVSDALAVAVQEGTGDVNINGGVLIVNGAADVGEAGDSGTPGIGSLTIAAGGSMSVSDTLDIGVLSDGGVGTVVVSGDDSTASLGGLVVGDAGIGTLTLNSGAQVTTSDDVVIGNASGATGLVTVNGDGTLLDDGGALTVGAGGSGEIDINQGSVEVFAGTVTLGASANASGTLTLANSSLGLSGSLLIGQAGSGSLSVGSDGSLQAQAITLGQATNGGGYLTVSGDGAAVQSSGLTVGAGGSGVLAVSAQGSLDTTGTALLGTEALPGVQQQASVVSGAQWTIGSGLTVGEAGNATLAIASGGEVSAGSVVLGDQGGADGTVTVSGTIGTVGSVSASSLLFGGELVVGNAGTATLEVSQGGVVGLLGTLSGTIEIGAGGSGVGSIDVSHGTVSAASLIVAESGSGTISVGSGGIVTAGSVHVGTGGIVSLAGGLLDPLAAITLAAGGTIAGFGTLAASLADSGLVDASGGTLDVTGGVSGSGSLQLAAGSTLQLDAAVTAAPTVAFSSGTATLILGSPGLNTNLFAAMTGVAVGDQIELGGGTTITSVSYTPVSGGQNVTLDLSQNATSGTITLNDVQFVGGANHFAVTNPSSGNATLQAALCFCAGTCIATPGGETPVERLAAGDLVLTQRGDARRIAWIGVGKVLATRGQRSAATPVIVRKGAFADNVPHRDLRVTKGHAFNLDGVLIPAEFLINHGSILWDDRAQEVALYHIELASHDVLLANGAPAESYRDDGNRWLFQNANSSWHLPPQPPCAPVLTGGPIVDAVWRRLLQRGGAGRKPPLTDDPDLHLVVDGQRIDPIEQRASVHVFRLRQRARMIRMCSRAAVPQELGIMRDHRALGVAVRRIVLAHAGWRRTLEADAASLTDGYHAFEPGAGIRWTNGDADVPAELFAGVNGPCMLLLHLGGATRYLDDGRTMRAA